MFLKRSVAVAVVAVLASSSPAAAQASSTFDLSAEGWQVGDFYDSSIVGAATFVPIGGNPGGFVRTDDVSNWVAFVAPGAYLGDQHAAYGGELRFDLRTNASSGFNDGPLLRLAGNGLMLFYDGATEPGTDWTSFVVPLSTSSLWRTDAQDGAVTTETEFRNVLANLSTLRIQADIIGGPDQTDLDNVQLVNGPQSSVPEPGSWALLGSGLLGLGAVAGRRRRA